MMDAFLHACGVHPALELEVEATSQARSTRYCLRQPFAIVGRHPASDVYLDSDGIRPRHVYFQAIEGRIACINVSQTGTIQTSEAEVESFCWLKPNESVQFGKRAVKLVQEEQEAAPVQRQEITDPLAPGSAWEIFGPRITLEITNDDTQGIKKTWLVDRLLTLVGRTPKCAIQLNDEVISNVHCSLVLTSTGLWVVDLLGRGGLVINEQPVRVGQLGLEDELRIGPFRIRLQEMPIAIKIPDEMSFRPLTPAGEFLVLPPSETGSHHQIRMYHTPWPDDVSNADVLEELMEKLQDMHGPMFTQYQHVITKMIETYDQLSPKEQEAVKSELDRLRRLSEEVESIEHPQETVDTPGNIVLPAPAEMESFVSNAESESVRPDALNSDSRDPASGLRTANSLLKGMDTSVFRIPQKSGDLFENANAPESKQTGEGSLHTWSDAETELLSPELMNEAHHLTEDQLAEDITYGYDPQQHEEFHPNPADYQPFIPPHPENTTGPHAPTDREKAAHLWLHDRIDILQEEQSSIWQKLSQFFFGKSSW